MGPTAILSGPFPSVAPGRVRALSATGLTPLAGSLWPNRSYYSPSTPSNILFEAVYHTSLILSTSLCEASRTTWASPALRLRERYLRYPTNPKRV